MPRFRTAATAALLAIPIVAGGFLMQESPAKQSPTLLAQVMQLVSERYVDSAAATEVYARAARGLVRELNDPYSELLSPKESEDFARGTNGRYGGTGMYIGEQDGLVIVDRVFPHTPAEDAGVTSGDRIVSVDGTPTRGLPLDKVSGMLRGTIGTRVSVTYARPGVTEPIVRNLVRREIHIPAVLYSAVLGEGVGYIPLQTFNENAADEVQAAIGKLKKEGARSLILDMRDNPGGIVEQALDISGLFLKDGQEILRVRGREGEPEVARAESGQPVPDLPLVVLVDDGSASASEIVAGALQDHDRALIVGTTSYGKGLVQSLYQLADGYSLKMTTGKWYTPSGRSIHRERKLQPDGKYVEVLPDSLERDSVRAKRPTFRSDAGRTVYGGGGITPDVIVPADTLTALEQEFLRWAAPHGQAVQKVIADYSFELKSTVKSPAFTVPPSWSAELAQRLQKGGVQVPERLRAVGMRLLVEEVEYRVTRLAFGDASARVRSVARDTQLMRAIELLERSRSQGELLTRAQPAR